MISRYCMYTQRWQTECYHRWLIIMEICHHYPSDEAACMNTLVCGSIMVQKERYASLCLTISESSRRQRHKEWTASPKPQKLTTCLHWDKMGKHWRVCRLTCSKILWRRFCLLDASQGPTSRGNYLSLPRESKILTGMITRISPARYVIPGRYEVWRSPWRRSQWIPFDGGSMRNTVCIRIWRVIPAVWCWLKKCSSQQVYQA